MSCDYDKEYKCGDSLYDLTKKILGRLKEIVGLGGGGGGGDVTLTVSDVEIGAVELKDSTTDNRATVRNSDPDPADYALVVRNIPSGTQVVSGPLTDAELRASAVPISVAALPLPSGAATETTLGGVLTTVAFQTRINSLGQKTMAASTPVVLASNQSAIPVTQSGTWNVIAGQSVTWNRAVLQEGVWNVGQTGNFIVEQDAGDTWQVQASQGGTWNINAAQSGAWTVNQGGSWNVGQSGAWIVGQSGAWTVAATQSGAWTVQPGDTQNAVPWLTANDWRRNAIPKRYSISVQLTPGAATAGTNLLGLRKLNANPDIYILRIRVHVHQAAAGVACVLAWSRATTVAAGTLINAADIPKHDTAAGNATLEVRTGAVTGTEAAQRIISHPAHSTAAPAAGVGSPWIDEWIANDRAGAIRLTGDEGLILEQFTAGDTDNRYYLLVEWEEA